MSIAMIPQWNSEAIIALQMGDTRRAVATLKKALNVVRTNIDQTEDDPMAVEDAMPSSSCCSSHHSSTQQPQESIRSVVISDETDDADSPYDTSDSALFTFYPNAFEVVEVSTSKSDYKQSVVLLFNMALAMDTLAQRVAKVDAAVNLQRNAVGLYAAARDLVLFHWDNGASVPGLRTLLLASANNLGRIQSLHLSFKDTRDCLMLTLDLLSFENAMVEVQDDDYDQLCLSVAAFLYLQRDSILTAAPAA